MSLRFSRTSTGTLGGSAFAEQTVSVLKMLETERQVSHIPVNPILLAPVAQEAEEPLQQYAFNGTVVTFHLVFGDIQRLSDGMKGKARRLPRGVVHHHDRGDARGKPVNAFVVKALR